MGRGRRGLRQQPRSGACVAALVHHRRTRRRNVAARRPRSRGACRPQDNDAIRPRQRISRRNRGLSVGAAVATLTAVAVITARWAPSQAQTPPESRRRCSEVVNLRLDGTAAGARSSRCAASEYRTDHVRDPEVCQQRSWEAHLDNRASPSGPTPLDGLPAEAGLHSMADRELAELNWRR